MIRCRRFRIELTESRRGGVYHVSVEPVAYLGRPEFKAWMRLCRAAFMDLTHSFRRWRMVRSFEDEDEAARFAAELAYDLEEPVWMRLGEAALCRIPAVDDTRVSQEEE